MSAPLHSRFTPSLMGREALEATFVQRESLVEDLVNRIRESAGAPGKHHTILVGPRGIGKTHLISLVYHRVGLDDSLKNKLAVAWLREEEWGVSSFLDLLLRVLRALRGDEAWAAAEPPTAIYDVGTRAAEAAAARLIEEAVAGKTLLVLAENLDEIFRGLGESGQKRLRAYMQEHPYWTILATCRSLFGGVSLRTSPFFGFFRIEHLEELKLEEARDLLVKLANFRGNKDLSAALETPSGRARVRAIHHFAGGNHRIFVILADFLDARALDNLADAFLAAMDDLTPYYQARIAWLSPQQRKIVEVLCEERGAIPVKEIAKRCFLSHQGASSQLKVLKDLGYVTSTAVGRDSFYELRESLMRVSVELKKNRGEPIRLFVEFLSAWYSKEELDEQALGASRNATQCGPGVADGWTLRGYFEYATYRYADGAESFDRALEQDRSYRAALYGKILSLAHLQHRDQLHAAIRAAESTLGGDPFLAHCRSLMEALSKPDRDRRQLLISLSETSGRLPLGGINFAVAVAVMTEPFSTDSRMEAAAKFILEHCRQAGVVARLGRELVGWISAMTAEGVDLDAARGWVEMWRRLASGIPEAQVPLRLLGAAVEFLEARDGRVLLRLPVEERSLLAPLLGVGSPSP